MTLDQFKAVWARAAAKAATREKEYSALDAAAGGDGDHGGRPRERGPPGERGG